MTGTTEGQKYGFFLGCIAPLRFPDIEAATRFVFSRVGADVGDVEGLGCCPSRAAFPSVDEIAALSVSARNFSLAEDQGVHLVTICSGCFSGLAESKHEIDHHPEKRAEVNETLSKIGREYRGTSKVFHFAQYLHDVIGVEKISSTLERSLDGLRIAIFHGCHYLRPSDVLMTDDPEDPKKVVNIVKALGAQVVPYTGQLDCCGAGGGLRARDPETSVSMADKRLKAMTEAGVDAIVTVCPFCFMQLDLGQAELNEKGASYSLPVFHLNQLIALAQGADPSGVARFSKTPRQKITDRFKEGGP